MRARPLLVVGALLAVVALARAHGHAGAAPLPQALGGVSAPGTEETAQGSAARWSTPAPLSTCDGAEPRVLFPNDTPSHGTGPGAIVWSAGAACPEGGGARIAVVGAADDVLPAAVPRDAGGPIALRPPLGAASAPHGELVLAGTVSGRGRMFEGTAPGPFRQLGGTISLRAPFALSTAYLGDVALLAPAARSSLTVQIERWFAHSFSAPRHGDAGAPAPVRLLSVAMDFRSDALAAWVQGSSIYTQYLPASGVHHPVQRIAAAGAHVHLATLVSDDNRGMVAFEQEANGQTSMYLDYSQSGVRFGAPRLVERFHDPDQLPLPAGAPRLVRLSSESVMIAWAGAGGGRWTVRTAAVDQHGIGAPGTIAATRDALLQDLAPGPSGEALALFSVPQAGLTGAPDTTRQTLLAARGFDVVPDRTTFDAPQQIAPPGPVSEATVALDPDTDAALAAWAAGSAGIEYSVRPGG